MSSYYISSPLVSSYSYSILYNIYISLSLSLYLSILSLLSLFLSVWALSLLLSISALSLLLSISATSLFYLYGGYPSRFLPICMWAICLTHYMDRLSSLLYMCYLSSYSYGGYPSCLLSTRAVHSVCVATIEPTLEHMLETNSLT
jgi:hypothetical protein